MFCSVFAGFDCLSIYLMSWHGMPCCAMPFMHACMHVRMFKYVKHMAV